MSRGFASLARKPHQSAGDKTRNPIYIQRRAAATLPFSHPRGKWARRYLTISSASSRARTITSRRLVAIYTYLSYLIYLGSAAVVTMTERAGFFAKHRRRRRRSAIWLSFLKCAFLRAGISRWEQKAAVSYQRNNLIGAKWFSLVAPWILFFMCRIREKLEINIYSNRGNFCMS